MRRRANARTTLTLAFALALTVAGCADDAADDVRGDTTADAASEPTTDTGGETDPNGGTATDDPDGEPGGETDDDAGSSDASQELPAGWPDEMPVPESATIQSSMDVHDDGSYLQVLALADAPVADVGEFYQDVLDERGWEVSKETTAGTLAMWHVSGNGWGTSKVELHQRDDGTSVMLDLYAGDAS